MSQDRKNSMAKAHKKAPRVLGDYGGGKDNPVGRKSGDHDYRFKVVLLGDSKVGKTSIVRRLVEEAFNLKYEGTQNFDTVDKKWFLDNGTSIVLQIWDTAGLDRYNSLQDSYFNGATGFMVIFDYQNKQTFGNIRNWINVI